MSKNINFIPANKLPVTEGNEVSVLCLENGEMKQKPASGLGGGGYDAVIKFTHDPDNEWDEYTLESGDYAAIYAKFAAGELPRVLIKGSVLSGENAGLQVLETAVSCAYYGNSDAVIAISFLSCNISILPNGELYW